MVLALAACDRVSAESQAETVAPPPPAAQCVRDGDCVLLPDALTCCVECPPVPPFHAAPSWVLDGMLIENETDCVAHPRCPAVTCEAPPAGCEARAACVDGRCTAIATGCGLPRS